MVKIDRLIGSLSKAVILTLGADDSTGVKGVLHELKELGLEERSSGTYSTKHKETICLSEHGSDRSLSNGKRG